MKTSELLNAKESSKKLNILKEESKMKKLLTTILIILVLFVAVPFSNADYEVLPFKVAWPLTNDTYNDVKPQINNAGEVVYEKHLIGDSEIYIIIDDGEYNVSNSPGGFDYNPQINSSGDVLWESDVKGWHFITLQPSDFHTMGISPPDPDTPPQLLPLQYWGQTYPQFNDNNQVVWRAFTEMNKDDIWLYNNFDNYKKYKKLSISYGDKILGQMDKHPQINANGDVVWQRGVIDSGKYGDELEETYYYDIFLYDGTTPPKNISNRIGVDDTHPQINDAGVVVWESDGQIYRYSEGVPKKISYNSGYSNFAPQIINHCGVVVWQGCNDSDSDCEIFLYKDEYGAINISNDPGHHDDFPQINEKGQVVWVRDYSSDLPMKGLEVMLFDPFENTLTNISNRNGDDEDPQINDKGEVVWSGYHEGNGSSEIFRFGAAPKLKVDDDVWQLGVVYTISDLCESISDIFWSSVELQVVDKVEFKKEKSQVSKIVKVPLHLP